MIEYEEFMKWFVNYVNKATLDVLKREPLEFNERVAYLNKKFEESQDEPR